MLSCTVIRDRKVESVQGSRLLPIADFHLGSDCNIMINHALPAVAVPFSVVPFSAVPFSALAPHAAANGFGGVVPPRILPSILGNGLQYAHSTSAFSGLPNGNAVVESNNNLSGTQQVLVPFGTTLDKQNAAKSCVILGTADGSLGILLPLDEKIYRRLALLQQLMLMGVKSKLSFNPKDFRSFKSTTRVKLNVSTGGGAKGGKSNVILDGTILWKFYSLPIVLQEELSIVIGTTRDIILENLNRLDRLCAFF
jgi:hypothetical protein